MTNKDWPALPLDAWRDTYATLHMWTQIAGKLCLALTPRTNHFWNVAFQVMSRGFATPSLTAGEHSLTITFDFVSHQLVFQCSDGRTETIEKELNAFLESTYDRAAALADWNRADLERQGETKQ